jgi:hypothetical protein
MMTEVIPATGNREIIFVNTMRQRMQRFRESGLKKAGKTKEQVFG